MFFFDHILSRRYTHIALTYTHTHIEHLWVSEWMSESKNHFYQWTISSTINHERHQPTEFNSICLVWNVSSIRNLHGSSFRFFHFAFSVFHMLILNNVYFDAQRLIYVIYCKEQQRWRRQWIAIYLTSKRPMYENKYGKKEKEKKTECRVRALRK